MKLALTDPAERADTARQIFQAALAAVDPVIAVSRSVSVAGGRVMIADQEISSPIVPRKIVAVAIGKAAFTMATGLQNALGPMLARGIAVGPEGRAKRSDFDHLSTWTCLAGGHPLPNEASFQAGQAVIDFVRAADASDTAIVFLISGGGSAMVECPIDPRITAYNLARLNSLLIASGAPIGEINVVRRSFSAIKGGRLARFAPLACKIGLIVSDTNPGDERSVASGPTIRNEDAIGTARNVLRQYELLDRLPPLLHELIDAGASSATPPSPDSPVHHQVILQNSNALAGMAAEARRLGFQVEVAADICEQEIAAGCRALVERIISFEPVAPLCLLSGGEFACKVNGNGRGGRNTESTLRIALLLREFESKLRWQVTAMCAGTDGIDGNCTAAGAIADETTVDRASALGLDAVDYLPRSDSFSLLDAVGDAIMTGPTGTNVRDVRALLAVPRV